jgi:peroxidase
MYQHPNKTYGLDLISMIIQEGRDHGVPPYIDFRKKCQLSEINSFNDLVDIWDPSALQRVKEVFLYVTKVSLFLDTIP